MTTKFYGSLVQDASTAEYLFTPPKMASYLSGFLTLRPEDMVSSGSVGWTKKTLGKLDPTEYTLLRRRGVLEFEVERIRKLINPVTPFE